MLSAPDTPPTLACSQGLSQKNRRTPDGVTVHAGDCLCVLRTMPDHCVDSVVTDPPAGISFMQRSWDTDKGGRDAWVAWLTAVMTEVRRVLKPGGHALVWALPRTSHWTATALEDAGLEIRDCVVHLFGSGFPKSLDVAKALDKAAGAEREVVGSKLGRPGYSLAVNAPGGRHAYGEWTDAESECAITAPATDDAKRWGGWGTALKPGQEIWWLVRKPLEGTVAANVLAHGVGGINVDGCRVPGAGPPRQTALEGGDRPHVEYVTPGAGRWPTNLALSHGLDCVEGGECAPGCPVAELDRQSGVSVSRAASRGERHGVIYGGGQGPSGPDTVRGHDDSGGASRFFPVFRYQAKAPARERPRLPDGTAWPTVKPLGLMRWLVRLVTPPGGLVLDPFGGTGTTAEACHLEGFRCVLIESDPIALELTRVRLGKLAQK